MRSDLRKAVEMAVEVLEDLRGADTGYDIGDTVRCLRDALAEQEVEPRWLVLEITTAYEQGVGKGQQRRAVTNPYTEGSPGRTAWAIGYTKGLKMKAEQEAEPVAWMSMTDEGSDLLSFAKPTEDPRPVPLFAHPPRREWQTLTDEEILSALIRVDAETKRLPLGFRAFARSVEEALRRKNHG